MQRVVTLFLIYLLLLVCISWIPTPYRLTKELFSTDDGFYMQALIKSPVDQQADLARDARDAIITANQEAVDLARVSYTAISGKTRNFAYGGSLTESSKTHLGIDSWGSSQEDCERKGKELCDADPSCTAVEFNNGLCLFGECSPNSCVRYSSEHTAEDLFTWTPGGMHWKKGGF